MLPTGNRLRRPPEFSAAVRHGRRAGRGAVVVHLLVRRETEPGLPPADPRVGLVVGRAVGPAVVRNRVKRRLRALLRERLGLLPPGSLLVVRASPAAAGATSAALAADVEAALARVLKPRGASPAPASPSLRVGRHDTAGGGR